MGKSVSETLNNAINFGMYVVQFYLGSSRSYKRSAIPKLDLEKCLAITKKTSLIIFTHSPTIYNLAGSTTNGHLAWTGDDRTDDQMTALARSLSGELLSLSCLGARGTVVHPGYTITGKTIDDAITAIAQTLDHVTFQPGVKVILEICAGERKRVGSTLRELATIRERTKHPENIGFCFDTAHTWGGGIHDLRTLEGVDAMFADINDVGGIDLIHLNDSKTIFGSGRDLHESIGQGQIWGKDITSLIYLIGQASKRKIPIILETVRAFDLIVLQQYIEFYFKSI